MAQQDHRYEAGACRSRAGRCLRGARTAHVDALPGERRSPPRRLRAAVSSPAPGLPRPLADRQPTTHQPVHRPTVRGREVMIADARRKVSNPVRPWFQLSRGPRSRKEAGGRLGSSGLERRRSRPSGPPPVLVFAPCGSQASSSATWTASVQPAGICLTACGDGNALDVAKARTRPRPPTAQS